MACDVIIERLDTEDPLVVSAKQDDTLDDLMVTVAEQCNISPVATTLFAFKQGSSWMSPSLPVNTIRKLDKNLQPIPIKLQLRIRYMMPHEKPTKRSKLREIDPVAFDYFYCQVRKDFEEGAIWNKRLEKEQKWNDLVFPSDRRESKEEKRIRITRDLSQLATLNIAIDIYNRKISEKDISKAQSEYIPKHLFDSGDKLYMLFTQKFNIKEMVHRHLSSLSSLRDLAEYKRCFVNETQRHFPAYFCECFPVKVNKVERKLICIPPMDEKPATLVWIENLETYHEIATIDQLCNIAIQDNSLVELSRRNGIPVYFSVEHYHHLTSMMTLICAYYRLTEKWTFSLSPDIKFPNLDKLINNKVHGPVCQDFALASLKKHEFKKGYFLIRQCMEKHRTYFLHYCHHPGKRPNQVTIQEDPETGLFYLRPTDSDELPDKILEGYSCISELVRALRNTASLIELDTWVHPTEFEKSRTLLLCRTDEQLRLDYLSKHGTETDKEKIIIQPRQLKRYEQSLSQGRMCSVVKGTYTTKKVEEKVAIKHLNKSFKESHSNEFLAMASKAFNWDDPSLINTIGIVLPHLSEPAMLVTEYFDCGPLDKYLAEHKSTFQNVDLMEAAACLARGLHYLSENGIVHGEIRARNVFVSCRTDDQFKVKLSLGSLIGPRPEDVHWLDFAQLHAALASSAPSIFNVNEDQCQIHPTFEGDVWSLGTTLWELFSFGEKPTLEMDWKDAARRYLHGNRLRMPALLSSGQLVQVGHIVTDCWQPDVSVRKTAQALMRDINQLLFKVFNSRRPHNYAYVTIDPGPPSPDIVTMNGGQHNDTASSISSTSMDLPTPPLNCLVPMFTDISRKMMDHSNNRHHSFGSSSPLFNPSGSSRSGSIFNTDMSALTYQTSLDMGSDIYSISSIYQFDDSSVEYSKEFPMGEGNFGVVYRGVRNKSDGDWEEVAIKEIKDTDTMPAQAHDDMEREVSLMKKLSHDNIVKIRGVITSGSNTIIVMEFIREGSLDKYLQINRHSIDYPKQLFGYAQNIADGMEYLTLNKIIHRDLAARNILVADQETVKISDFGLARVATNDTYVMNSSSNIPVRWEAIECLTHRKYSHKSDVWSFGVTLWEMFSFGQTPALQGCEDFFTCYERQRQDFRDWLQKLEDGVRLPHTELCPNFLYSRVMSTCWYKEPTARPTFRDLKSLLRQAELEVT